MNEPEEISISIVDSDYNNKNSKTSHEVQEINIEDSVFDEINKTPEKKTNSFQNGGKKDMKKKKEKKEIQIYDIDDIMFSPPIEFSELK